MDINHTALVLEGGGMRCVFTAGVLDCFMQAGIIFPYTIAVSGGSINGLSYMSGQQGRNRDIMIEYLRRERYIGPLNYLHCGSFIFMPYFRNMTKLVFLSILRLISIIIIVLLSLRVIASRERLCTWKRNRTSNVFTVFVKHRPAYLSFVRP
jgi:hypothetical protein